MITNGNRKYVIPLSSAKEKHKDWKDSYPDRFLIYKYELKDNLPDNAIWVETEEKGKVKHILSVVDLKKMIPVKDNVMKTVDFTVSTDDSENDKKYKDLLDKEYAFCVRIADAIVRKASRIYQKQMETGKVMKFGCDFSKLERAMDAYTIYEAGEMKRREGAEGLNEKVTATVT